MGLSFTKLFDWVMGKKEMRVVMVGLDCAGKTTILFRLKRGEVIRTIPTIGFNVETVEYNNIRFTVFDISGHRALWRHYFYNTQALVYVVDSSDHDRMGDARNELHSMLKVESLKADAALLVFANKQDKPDAMSLAELTDALDLRSIHQRRWHIQSACATSGEGLYEGFDWIINICAQG